MSEMTAARMGSRHSLVLAAVVLASAALWAAAIALLWHTEIPSNLRLPSVDPHRFFTSAELTRYWRYERFYYLTWALSLVATVVALVLLARRAPRWARSIGLGRVGTGVIIGMLTL